MRKVYLDSYQRDILEDIESILEGYDDEYGCCEMLEQLKTNLINQVYDTVEKWGSQIDRERDQGDHGLITARDVLCANIRQKDYYHASL